MSGHFLRIFAFSASVLIAAPSVSAQDFSAPFASIDGGTLSLAQWAGQPVLIVNTASQCAYTKQYAQLQALYDRFKARGLVVLAVPSDDFRQELSSNADVKAFCEMQYGIDLPMTEITSVKGRGAHPVFAAIADETGFVPRWNFNKVLIGRDGRVAQTYRARVAPMDEDVIGAIETELDKERMKKGP